MYQEEWYDLLPPELIAGVIKYKNEWVWYRQQALHIMDWLAANSYVVTKIETWFPTQPGPTVLINDWSKNRVYPSPPFPMSARNFVATFTADPKTEQVSDLEPVFNISAEKAKE